MKTRRTAHGNAARTADNHVQAGSRNALPLRGANAEKTKRDTSILKLRPAARAAALRHVLIAERACDLWRERGCMPSPAAQNWYEAEALLRAELEEE